MNNLMTTDNREIFFNVQEKDLYSPDGDYAHDNRIFKIVHRVGDVVCKFHNRAIEGFKLSA